MSWLSEAGKKFDEGFRTTIGMNTRPQRQALGAANQANEDHYNYRSGVLADMSKNDTDYFKSMQGQTNSYINNRNNVSNEYLGRISQLQNEARQQATDARQVYSNTIQPNMINIMEDAKQNAAGAMTLQQAGDPNNQVHQAVRGMYDQQAQGVRKQGLADYGVLSALGNQATMNTMGSGMPMTGSQFQLTQANNMNQASMAYNNAQLQMQRLKEQGIERGFEESDRQYQRGQGAKDRYRDSVRGVEDAMDRNNARQQDFRNIDQGYAGDRYGIRLGSARENYDLGTGLGGLAHQLNTGKYQRDLQSTAEYYGDYNSGLANQIAMMNAENANKLGLFKEGVKAVSSYAGKGKDGKGGEGG